MTEPIQPVDSSTLVAAGVEAVKSNAENLDLQWKLRYATVVSVGDGVIDATYDGDVTPIPMISFIGNGVDIGDRVAAIFVPPSGNYVIKSLTHREGVKVVAAKQFTTPGAFIASNSLATEQLFSDGDLAVPMIAGNWYHIFMDFDFHLNSTAAMFVWRIRETNLAGAVVGGSSLVPGAGNAFTRGRAQTWIRAASTETQVYVVTGQRNTGAASWGAFANDGHETLQAHDYGSASIVVDS